MREYPWDSRRLTWQHLRRFGLIHAQWKLTRTWVEELGQPQSLLNRKGVTPGLDEVGEILRYWEQAAPGPVCREDLLGALSPEECLERLGAAVRVQQSLVLDQLLRKVPDSRQRLPEISSAAGHRAGKSQVSPDSVAAPFSAHRTLSGLRDAHASVAQGPFSCMRSQNPSGVIVERVTASSLEWIELECPHRDPLFEVGPVADVLCDLHSAWRAGYFRGLDPAWKTARLAPDPVASYCRFSVSG